MTEEEYLKKLQENLKEMNVSMYEDYGSEDQNTLMDLILNHKGDYDTMDEKFVEKVTSLVNEIENYEQVISDASSAMTSAEMELSAVMIDNEQ